MNQSNSAGAAVPVVGRSQGRASHEPDPTLTRAMNEYLEGLEAGQPGDREAILRRYPELADELVSCLDGIDFIHQVAPQLGEATPLEEGHDSSEKRPPAAPLGDYRIIREIGRGGMGVVYEAEQLSMRRRVALKVLPFAAVMDPRQIARFKNEAQAAGLLQHTNIVPVYGVGCERSVHYYAMQYIEGTTLAEMIEQMRVSPCDAGVPPASDTGGTPAQLRCVPRGTRSPDRPSDLDPTIDSGATADSSDHASQKLELSVRSCDPRGAHYADTPPLASLSTQRSLNKHEYFRTIARLGIQAAEALDHAHKNGILHRDVKPGNLMLDMTGNLWVTDFGLARMEGNGQMTISGDLVGTLRYMSPEQALANRVIVDHRTDIYSLGVTLYELLTLRPVFEGTDRQELLRQIAFEEPRPLYRVDKSIPSEFQTIVFKAMAKNPMDRYATAQDLADDLRRLLMHEPIKARPPSLSDRLAKWSRRHRAWVLAAASMLIVLTVGSLVSTAMIWREQLRTENALSGEKRQRELARQKADEARRAAAEAEDQRQRAETGFKKAREAINRMLTRVADEYLPVNPELESFRRRVLEDALEFSSELIALNPQDPHAYLERGLVNNYLNRLADAQADFEKSIELEPENAEWHFNLGWFLSDRMQDFHRALDPLRRAIELDPETAEYHVKLARAHRRAGELGRALSVLEELIRVEPLCAHAYMERAWIHHATGDLGAMLADAKRAFELEPLCGVCQETLASAHQYLGQSDEALALMNHAIEVPWSCNHYKSQVANYAGRSWVYAMRGNIHMSKRMYEAALADYEKGLADVSTGSWFMLKRRAFAHFQIGHYAAALADLSRALELRPDDTSTVTWIPPSLVATCPDGTFRAGIWALADRAIELTNGGSDAYSRRGILYAQFNQNERARSDFDRAIGQSDASYYAWYCASLFYLTSDDKQGCQEMCRGMLERYRNTDDLDAAAFTVWSCVLSPEAVPDYGEVLRLAQWAVDRRKYDALALYAFGAALYRTGQIDQAIERLSETVLRPSLMTPGFDTPHVRRTSPAYASFFLAMAHHRLGHTQESRSWLTKAIEQSDATFAAAEGVSWYVDLTLRLLRREAESVLQDQQERDATDSPRGEVSP